MAASISVILLVIYFLFAREPSFSNQEFEVLFPEMASFVTDTAEVSRALKDLPANVTYAEHVGPIIQQNCQPCHRPGQVAPFSLLTYQDARIWSREIAYYTKARIMPPWKAAHGFGKFKNERRLDEREIALVSRWADSGAPAGDLNKLPPNPLFADEWSLGEPDLILEMPVVYELGPEGEDEFRDFVIPTNFEKDVYVKAVDIQPGNRKIVHHVTVRIDTTGKARARDAADPEPGFTAVMLNRSGTQPNSIFHKAKTKLGALLKKLRPSNPPSHPIMNKPNNLGGWVPGMSPFVLPDGMGTLLPKGGDIVLNMHYYRSGRTESDRTRVGLYFLEEPTPIRVYEFVVNNSDFTIPAGATRYGVPISYQLEEDVYLVAVSPHMHLLGSEMKAIATLPTGEAVPLIWADRYDFNWQELYYYQELQFLPKGSEIKVISYYDNSAGNPLNPNRPPQPVSFGYRSTDEMCNLYFRYIRASDYKQTE